MGELWLTKVENQREVIAVICEIVDERDDYKEEGVPRINLMDKETGILARLKARGHKEEDLPTARELGYSYKRTFAKYLKIDTKGWGSANSHRVSPTKLGRQFAARVKAPSPPTSDNVQKSKPEEDSPQDATAAEEKAEQAEDLGELAHGASELEQLRKKREQMQAELQRMEQDIEQAENQRVEDCAKLIEQLVKESGLPSKKFGKVIESAAKLLGYVRTEYKTD